MIIEIVVYTWIELGHWDTQHNVILTVNMLSVIGLSVVAPKNAQKYLLK